MRVISYNTCVFVNFIVWVYIMCVGGTGCSFVSSFQKNKSFSSVKCMFADATQIR